MYAHPNSTSIPTPLRSGTRAPGGLGLTATQPRASRTGTPAAPAKFRGRRVPKQELLTFTTQLSIMTRARMDLASALQSLSQQCRQPNLRAILQDVYESVTRGKRVSEALAAHMDFFGETYVASIAAGEASGRLSQVLDQLAHLQRTESKLRATMRTLMAYPIMLASISSLVLCALVLFVLPQFAGIFEQYEMPLPFVTRVLLGISSETRQRYWLWGPVLVFTGVGLAAFLRSAPGKRFRDYFVLNAKLLRSVTRSLLIGRTCRLLGIMISNGVPLLECLRLAKSAVKNSYYQDMFCALEQDVLNGRTMGKTLLAAEFIPNSAAEMITTAERTGTLGEVTTLLGVHFEDEGETRMKELVTVLEPAITVGMGLVVGIVVLAVMIPMFDIATFAQRQQ